MNIKTGRIISRMLFVALAVLLTGSCTKEQLDKQAPAGGRQISLNVSLNSRPGTKVAFTDQATAGVNCNFT